MYRREVAARKSHRFLHRDENMERKTSFCHDDELISLPHYHSFLESHSHITKLSLVQKNNKYKCVSMKRQRLVQN